MSLGQRVLGAVDLAIEFATLGEYGLEQIAEPPPGASIDRSCRRQRGGRRVGSESPATARRDICDRRSTERCRSAARTTLR